jgi:hypothetical protein
VPTTCWRHCFCWLPLSGLAPPRLSRFVGPEALGAELVTQWASDYGFNRDDISLVFGMAANASAGRAMYDQGLSDFFTSFVAVDTFQSNPGLLQIPLAGVAMVPAYRLDAFGNDTLRLDAEVADDRQCRPSGLRQFDRWVQRLLCAGQLLSLSVVTSECLGQSACTQNLSSEQESEHLTSTCNDLTKWLYVLQCGYFPTTGWLSQRSTRLEAASVGALTLFAGGEDIDGYETPNSTVADIYNGTYTQPSRRTT